jgi:predicted enzyme related to lactoylglutathione lyase
MRTSTILLALSIAIAAACGSDGGSAKASPPSTTQSTTVPSTTVPKTTAPPTTLPITRAPSTTTSGPQDPSATGKILMVKLYVGDLDEGQTFYGDVFGAKFALAVGAGAHIMTFPNGGPGLALIKAGAGDKNKKSAFIIQVPNLQATKALAVAKGAKLQGKFAGAPGGQAAKSIDLLDPWGNQVEILQVG